MRIVIRAAVTRGGKERPDCNSCCAMPCPAVPCCALLCHTRIAVSCTQERYRTVWLPRVRLCLFRQL